VVHSNSKFRVSATEDSRRQLLRRKFRVQKIYPKLRWFEPKLRGFEPNVRFSNRNFGFSNRNFRFSKRNFGFIEPKLRIFRTETLGFPTETSCFWKPKFCVFNPKLFVLQRFILSYRNFGCSKYKIHTKFLTKFRLSLSGNRRNSRSFGRKWIWNCVNVRNGFRWRKICLIYDDLIAQWFSVSPRRRRQWVRFP
jgi:hypothetical protein